MLGHRTSMRETCPRETFSGIVTTSGKGVGSACSLQSLRQPKRRRRFASLSASMARQSSSTRSSSFVESNSVLACSARWVRYGVIGRPLSWFYGRIQPTGLPEPRLSHIDLIRLIYIVALRVSWWCWLQSCDSKSIASRFCEFSIVSFSDLPAGQTEESKTQAHTVHPHPANPPLSYPYQSTR